MSLSVRLIILWLLQLFGLFNVLTSDLLGNKGREDQLRVPIGLGVKPLGFLYDARTKTYVPGLSLWKSAPSKSNIRKTPLNNHKISYIVTESLNSAVKELTLGLEAKITLLWFIEVNVGRTTYGRQFIDLVHTNTGVYSHKIRCHEEYIGDLLDQSNIDYPEILNTEQATHVVVGVEYGAEYLFKIEYTATNKTSSSSATGILNQVKGVLDKLTEGIMPPTSQFQNLTVSYDGDVPLKFSAGTFTEAMAFLSKFKPSTNESSGCFPKFAILNPIWWYRFRKNNINSNRRKEPTVVSDEGLLGKMQHILEVLDEVKAEMNFQLGRPIVEKYPELNQLANRFSKALNVYQIRLNSYLQEILPDIRNGSKDYSKIDKLIQRHERSPFKEADLDHWVKKLDAEVDKDWHVGLEEYQFVDTNGLEKVKHNVNYDVVHILDLRLYKCSDSLTDELEKYLQETEGDREKPYVAASILKEKPWVEDKNAHDDVLMNVQQFTHEATSPLNAKHGYVIRTTGEDIGGAKMRFRKIVNFQEEDWKINPKTQKKKRSLRKRKV